MENLPNLFNSHTFRKCKVCNGKGSIAVFVKEKIYYMKCGTCKGKGWILVKEDDWFIYDNYGDMDMFIGFK